MQIIAHRLYADKVALDQIDARLMQGVQGVELDLRHDANREVIIQHSPIFRARSGDARHPRKPLEQAIGLLSEIGPGLQTLILDVKTSEAAGLAAAVIARSRPRFDIAFACWRAEEVAAIRENLPGAMVLFCVAPIFLRRGPRGRLRDLYVTNSFPFVACARSFIPKPEKTNGHNINVKLICKNRLAARLPRGVDGLCVHRLFHREPLIDFAAARKLRTAVYGLPSFCHPRTHALEGVADFAIVKAA
jgi:hypothetical protein